MEQGCMGPARAPGLVLMAGWVGMECIVRACMLSCWSDEIRRRARPGTRERLRLQMRDRPLRVVRVAVRENI